MLIISIFYALLIIYHVTLNDRGNSWKICQFHPKWIWFQFVIRFYKTPLSVLEMLHVDTRGNINITKAVKFLCEAPQVRCRSKCKCGRVTAIQTAYTERKVKVPNCSWKNLNKKENRLKVKRSLYRPGQLLRFRGVWSFQISGLSAREAVKVFSRMHLPQLPPRKYFCH